MNVLAVRHDNNGDVLLMGPALRALSWGARHLTLVCGPSGRAAAAALPGIDDVLCHEAAWIQGEPKPLDTSATQQLVAAVRERSIDRAVIFTSFHQSPLPMALLLRMAGVPFIGAICEDYPGSLLDVRHRGVSDDIHEVERALSLAGACGFALPPNDAGRLAMRTGSVTPLPELGPYIVVHPGSTVPARAWSPAANAELVRVLVAAGKRVVVTGSAAERELCALVAGNGAIDLCGSTDFLTLARVIADAQAIVVGNTGAAHVAAAVGTPVVSLFAPTVPAQRFRPWKVAHELLGRQDIGCRGCRAKTCPHEDQACLSGIGVADVLAALQALRVHQAARS